MAQKRPNLVQNLHFWSFGAKYCHFLHILSNARPKSNVNKVPRWVFLYVGNKTFDFSSKEIGFFAQKRPNLAQNWHFCPLLAHLVPCWWVGWWLWRGLYLARHLFTLLQLIHNMQNMNISCILHIFYGRGFSTQMCNISKNVVSLGVFFISIILTKVQNLLPRR